MAEDIKLVTITSDYREGRSTINSMLKRIPGVTLVEADLNTGDYVIGERVGIERKSATDFITSMMSSHLFAQIELMKEEFDKIYILVEGDVYATRSNISEDAILGFYSYITALTDAKLIFTNNTHQSAKLIHRLAIHCEHGLGYIPPLRSGKPKDSNASVQYLIQGLPSCGPQTAINLLKHFGSPAAIFAASIDQLKAVEGIGPKVAEKIWTVVNHGHL